MKRAVAVALLLATTASADVIDRLDTPVLRPLARALAVSVGKSLPIPAASSGVTFTFDPATSAFVRNTEVLGQVFLERAEPIGRGALNINVTYQYVDTDEYEGHPLDSLKDLNPIRDPKSGKLFIVPSIDFSLITHEITTSVTYGITDDAEVNLTIPVLHTTGDVSGRLLQLGGGAAPIQRGASLDSEVGVGDIFLRGKYRLLHGRWGDLGAGLLFRLPSGNEDNFQGTGLFEVSPRAYASTPVVELAPYVRVQAFLNAGLDLVPQDGSRGEGRYGVGIDILLATRLTLSVAFLAREPFGRLISPSAISVPRASGGSSPIFGIDPGHPSYYDVSIGGRVNIWGDTVYGIWNVRVPANDQGVRASIVPLGGIEVAW